MLSGLFTRTTGVRSVRLKPLQIISLLFKLGFVLPWTMSSGVGQIGPQWSIPVDITQPSESETGAFGVLLCDQYQNVHLLWGTPSTEGAAIYYRNDVSGSWRPPVDVLVVDESEAVYLDAAIADASDRLHLVWQNAYIGGDLYYSNVYVPEAADPRAWSLPRVIGQNTGAGSIATDAAGTVHLVYGTIGTEGMRPVVHYLKSEDNGQTWSEPVNAYAANVSVPSEIWGEIAVDTQGRIYVGVTLRSQEYGAQSEVGYVLSSDGGRTWAAYHQVEETGVDFQGVAKLVPYTFGQDVHLTWHDPRRMHQWSSDGGVTWSAPVEIMPLGAAFGGANHLVRDSAGTVHVVTAVADGVFSASWSGEHWSQPERIDHRYIDPHGQNMVVCQGNQLHVVYYDRTGGNKIWYANREVDAPHYDRLPFPARRTELTGTPTTSPEALTPTPAATAPIALYGDDNAEPLSAMRESESAFPLVVSTLLVIVLIAVAFVLRHRVRR